MRVELRQAAKHDEDRTYDELQYERGVREYVKGTVLILHVRQAVQDGAVQAVRCLELAWLLGLRDGRLHAHQLVEVCLRQGRHVVVESIGRWIGVFESRRIIDGLLERGSRRLRLDGGLSGGWFSNRDGVLRARLRRMVSRLWIILPLWLLRARGLLLLSFILTLRLLLALRQACLIQCPIGVFGVLRPNRQHAW